MCLGATDIALPAAIFCSLTNGVQNFEILNYTKEFALGLLSIFAAAKNFALKLKLLNHLRSN